MFKLQIILRTLEKLLKSINSMVHCAIIYNSSADTDPFGVN